MTYPAVPYRPTNGKAVAALVVGSVSLVLSICCLGLAGIAAIFLGIRARREIRESHDQLGDGLALAGIITGAVAAVVSTVLLVVVIVVIATGNADFDVYRG